MISSVTRLSPRRGTYENALEAFAFGHFSLCLEQLDGAKDSESLILAARAFLRIGQIEAALAAIDAVDQGNVSHEIAAEALAVKIYALHASRRGGEAAELSVEARARCFSSGFVAIEAEMIFAEVIGALSNDDCDKANAAITKLLLLDDVEPAWIHAKAYRLTLNYWRARALDSRASIAASLGDRVSEASNARLALYEFDKSGVTDQFLETAILANYANSAIDGGFADVIEFVNARASAMIWTAALVSHEFRIFSAIAEALSNIGDQLGALRSFRRCLDCAPTVPLQIRAGVERARLLSEVGETFSSREELDHAVRLSKTVNWEAVDVSAQRQLVFLAAQVASYSGEDAKRVLARFDSLTTSLPSNVSLSDERFRAEELFARGAVARANKETERAILLFIDALTSFVSANCTSRSALVAAELAELTNEPHYIAIAREYSVQQPFSLSAQKLARYDLANPTQPVNETSIVRHLTAVR